jgi:hypothetical protein
MFCRVAPSLSPLFHDFGESVAAIEPPTSAVPGHAEFRENRETVKQRPGFIVNTATYLFHSVLKQRATVRNCSVTSRRARSTAATTAGAESDVHLHDLWRAALFGFGLGENSQNVNQVARGAATRSFPGWLTFGFVHFLTVPSASRIRSFTCRCLTDKGLSSSLSTA